MRNKATSIVAVLLSVLIGIAAASIDWVDVELYPQEPVPHYLLP